MSLEELKAELVGLYKIIGLDENEALRKIELGVNRLLRENQNMKLEDAYTAIKSVLNERIQLMRRTGAKPLTFVVIGFGEYRNFNERRIREAMAKGMVKEDEDGNVIPVDDSGNPIPENWGRAIYCIYNDEFYTAYADMREPPVIGAEYYGFGRVNEGNKTIAVIRDAQLSLKNNLNGSKELWYMAEKALDSIIVPVEMVNEAFEAGLRFAAVKGFASRPVPTQRERTYMLYLNSGDLSTYIQVFVPEDIVPALRECEVLLLGRLSSNNDRLILNAVGAVLNPMTIVDEEIKSKILEELF